MPLKQPVRDRLKRLVESSVCPGEEASKYATQLKHLAEEVTDARLVDRQCMVFKALGDKTRLKILGLLSLREMCVCEVMVALDLTQPTASHHLHILENAGLVEYRKEGRWSFYSMARPRLMEEIQGLDLL